MTPNASDLMFGLRRLWWIPLLSVVAGVAVGLVASGAARDTVVTTETALFTMSVADAGNEAEGTARQAETALGQGRLSAYVTLTRTSEKLLSTLEAEGITEPVTGLSSTGGFKDPEARLLVDTGEGAGIVQIQLKNDDLTDAESKALIDRLTGIVVEEVKVIDAQQESPSIRSDVVTLPPQVQSEPASKLTRLAAPIFLSLAVGLGLVYLLTWRRGTINTRADLEDRLGARILSEFTSRPSDAATAALALCKGRAGTTRALIVPAGRPGEHMGAGWLGPKIADASRELGYGAELSGVDGRYPTTSSARAGESRPKPTDPAGTPPSRLEIADASTDGLDAQSLLAATHADIVGIIVRLGRTTVAELAATVHSLRETSEAELGVIAVRQKPKQTGSHTK